MSADGSRRTRPSRCSATSHPGRAPIGSASTTPFALGIEGAWGTGKSTLMERLRGRLEDDPSVATVTFNAWTAAQQDVAEGLVKTVLDKLDGSAGCGSCSRR